MAVRFLADGSYEFLDPVGVGVTAGNAGEFYDDGERDPPWADRPGQGRQDYTVNESLYWAQIPREQIAAIRPPVPQMLFPPIEGYGSNEALTISDIFEAGDYWTPTRRSWISGPPRVVRMHDLQDEGRGTATPGSMSPNPML